MEYCKAHNISLMPNDNGEYDCVLCAVERVGQRRINEQARAAKSAADSAAFEAAERLFGENTRVNAKLGE